VFQSAGGHPGHCSVASSVFQSAGRRKSFEHKRIDEYLGNTLAVTVLVLLHFSATALRCICDCMSVMCVCVCLSVSCGSETRYCICVTGSETRYCICVCDVCVCVSVCHLSAVMSVCMSVMLKSGWYQTVLVYSNDSVYYCRCWCWRVSFVVAYLSLGCCHRRTQRLSVYLYVCSLILSCLLSVVLSTPGQCLSVCLLVCLFCHINFEVMYLSIAMHRSLPVCCLLSSVWWAADCIPSEVSLCLCVSAIVCLSLGNSCESTWQTT